MDIMKKIIILTVGVCFICAAAVAADNKIRVTFSTDELAFSINILNSIDLTGEEVMPFIDIKNLLMGVYKSAGSGSKKTAEVDFTTVTAKNFLFFMQRAKLKGAEAVMFNDVSSRMVEAVKKAGG